MTNFGEEVTNFWVDSDPAYAKRLMEDILSVGPDKPLGYLPLRTVLDCGVTLSSAIDQARAAGNVALHLIRPEEWGDPMGSVYVYHFSALQALLDNRKEVPVEAGWPCEADPFVRRVAVDSVEPSTPLYDLIADAFSDADNPFRSDADLTK